MNVALASLLSLVVLAAMPGIVPAAAETASDKWSVADIVGGATTTTKPSPPTTKAPRAATTTTTRPSTPSAATTPTTTTTTAPAATATVPGQAPAPPRQAPSGPAAGGGASDPSGPSASRAPAGSQGPASPVASGVAAGFADGQLLRLLQGSAARRRHLDVRLTELEATLTRLEADLAAAQASLFESQTDQQDVAARFEATISALAQVQTRMWQALAERSSEPDAVQMPVLGPGGLGRAALGPARDARPAAGPGSMTRALDEILRWHRQLTSQAHRQEQELVEARQRTAAAGEAMAAPAAALDRERAALADLRRELSAALSDPTVMLQGRSLHADGAEMAVPSQLALSDIPADYLALYQQAALTCRGLSWTVLAAVGSIESNHGRLAAPGVTSGANFAGAMGPMQFLAPTWAAYGVDGTKDGTVDVYQAGDAIFGAANYLCASGAGDPARLPDAIWAYNHADWYVDRVLVLALGYGAGGLELVEASSADVAKLLTNPNLTLSPNARADLVSGSVDQRVVNFLAAATTSHRITVSVIKSGHSEFVAGTDRVSNHFHGRGIDIAAVDGAPVSPSNDSALDLALAVLTAAPSLRPDEFGSPWPGLAQFPGAFSDQAHQNHLHLGWR